MSHAKSASEPISPPRRKGSFREADDPNRQSPQSPQSPVAVPQHLLFGGPTGERIITTALDQRDEAVQRLHETEDDLRRVRQTMVEMEDALRSQCDDFEFQHTKTVTKQQKQQDHMLRGWSSATQQMMKKMTQLEQELTVAQEQRDTRPTLLQDALAANPENTVIRTMNVLVTKDRERDTFVDTTLRFQEFMEKIIQLESTASNNLDLAVLINEAKEMLQVMNLVSR